MKETMQKKEPRQTSGRASSVLENRSVLSVTLTAVLILAIAAVNVFAYALTNLFGLYFSTPQVEEPLSGSTDAMFESAISLGEEVTVTFCMDENTLRTHSTGSLVYQTAKALEERYSDSGFIKINYVNLITGLDSSNNRVDLEKYKTDMRGNAVSINASTVIFECKEQYKVVTDSVTSAGFYPFYTLDGSGAVYAYNGEEVLASMIAWVLTPDAQHGTAYMTQNHGETADVSLTTTLACAGYYVDVLNLRQREIPSDADLVIISAPTADFEQGGDGVHAEIERLDDYLDRGGDLLVIFDPMVKRLPVFEAFLAERGFRLPSVSEGSFARYLVRESGSSITADGMTFIAEAASDDDIVAADIFSMMSPFGGSRVLLSRSSYLKLSDGAKPLLTSSSDAVAVAGGKVYGTEGDYAVAAYNSIVARDGSSYANIAVIPGIYLTSSEASVTNTYTNKNFIYATMRVLFDSNAAPMGCKNIMTSTSVLEGLTQDTVRLITATVIAIPVVIAVTGAVILIRRKNR